MLELALAYCSKAISAPISSNQRKPRVNLWPEAIPMKNTKRSSARSQKKAQPEVFDLVFLGGRTGSTIAAWTWAKEGKRVAVVERKYLGGSCSPTLPIFLRPG
jgi:hypothetical protein